MNKKHRSPPSAWPSSWFCVNLFYLVNLSQAKILMSNVLQEVSHYSKSHFCPKIQFWRDLTFRHFFSGFQSCQSTFDNFNVTRKFFHPLNVSGNYSGCNFCHFWIKIEAFEVCCVKPDPTTKMRSEVVVSDVTQNGLTEEGVRTRYLGPLVRLAKKWFLGR